MIDLHMVRNVARNSGQLCEGGGTGIIVSAAFLEQVASEIEAGREAKASLDKIDANIRRTLNLPGDVMQ